MALLALPGAANASSVCNDLDGRTLTVTVPGDGSSVDIATPYFAGRINVGDVATLTVTGATRTLTSPVDLLDGALNPLDGSGIAQRTSISYVSGNIPWFSARATSTAGFPETVTYSLSCISAPPTLTGLSPASGHAGSSVTLSGTAFYDAGAVVTIGGIGATVTASDGSSIAATVPDLAPGSYPISVTTDAGTASGQTFTVVLPTITSASYDASTGVLAATGSGMAVGDSIAASKLTLIGEGGSSYTLTGGAASASSDTTFSVALGGIDKAALNRILNKNGSSSTSGTTYNLAAADDWDASATSGDSSDASNAVTVSNVPVPSITSATYDAATGALVVSGAGFSMLAGTSNDIVASKFTVTGASGAPYTLTDTANVEITSGTSFTLFLSATDRAVWAWFVDKDGTTASDGKPYNLSAAEDWAAGADPAVVVADVAGNGIIASNTDLTPPTVTSVAVPANGTYVAGQNLDFTVNFSEAVYVTGTPQIAITLDTGGAVNADYMSGSGTNALVFRYTVASGNLDSNGITVGSLTANGGTLTDIVGNNAVLTLNGVASTAAVLVDAVAPGVSSITRVGGAITNATSVDYTVTFSEDVSGIDASDFALTATGTVSGSVATIIAVDGSTYTVTVNGISGDGTLRLDLNGSGTGITDTPGNAIAAGYTAGEVYTFNHSAPVVTSVSVPADGRHLANAVLDFTVVFSDSVVVDTTGGTPTLPITLDSGTVQAGYVSGSGSNALTFRYTVASGDRDDDGVALGSAIVANGATLRDATGNAADLTLNGVAATTGVLVGQATQAITFGAQPAQAFVSGGTFVLNPVATADSGLAVSYASQTTAVCTISGTTVTMLTAGRCTIAADQAGDANYAAATTVTQSITIGQAVQAITGFTANPTDPVFVPNGTFTVSATGGASGNPLVFASTTPVVCSVAGTTVTMLSAGACALTADQAGNTSYGAAPQASLDVTIAAAVPTLSWIGPLQKVMGEPVFELPDPASDSDGAFGFSSDNPAVATVSGREVTITGPGTATLVATQAATGNYTQGSVSTTLTVSARPDPTRDPEVVGGLQAQVDASVRFASAQQANIHDRLRQLRTGHGNPSANNLTFSVSGGRGPGLSLNSGQLAGDMPSLQQGWGLWAAGTVALGQRDTRTGASGFDFRSDGVTIGVDHLFGRDTVLGVAGGLGWNNTEFDDSPSQQDATQRSIALYGLWRGDGQWFADGLLGLGRLDFDLLRWSEVAGATARAQREGDQAFGSLTFGYEHAGDRSRITGYGRFDASHTKLDAYRESGLGIYDLAYDRQTVRNSTLALGVEGSYTFRTTASVLHPYWSLEYRQALQNRGDAGLNYVVQPLSQGYVLGLRSYNDDTLAIGAGLDIDLDSGWGLSFLLRREQSSGAGSANTFGLRVSYGQAPAPDPASRNGLSPDAPGAAGWMPGVDPQAGMSMLP